MDNEIDVQELIILSGSQLRSTDRDIPVCYVGQMQPIYQQGPNGMAYSCAMSNVIREQGFMNGTPYCGAVYVPVNNGITGKTAQLPSLQGCCAKIGCSIDMNNVIIVPPNMQKG